MYQRLPSWILGFHGTDEETVHLVLNGKKNLEPSKNQWDWLGDGIYFWENDPERALEFAKQRFAWRKENKIAAVVGAVIDLGLCLNLFDLPALKEVKVANEVLVGDFAALGIDPPQNAGNNDDLIMRYRDRAVFQRLHELRKDEGLDDYQTVRAAFQEGQVLYDGTLIKDKNHIQVAIRDLKSIRGFFLPR